MFYTKGVFCNHEKSIECKLDRLHNIGSLQCRVCGVQWQTRINHLSEPVDIFSDWIDACEEENRKCAARRVVDALATPSSAGQQRQLIPGDNINDGARVDAAIDRSHTKIGGSDGNRPKKHAKELHSSAKRTRPDEVEEDESEDDDSFVEPDDSGSEKISESEEEEEELLSEATGASSSDEAVSDGEGTNASSGAQPSIIDRELSTVPAVKRTKLVIEDDD